jgi:hypothetical protein
MKKKLVTITTLLILMAVSSSSVFAEEPEVWNNSKNISGTVWFTTDYVFRGISNTNENPAIMSMELWTWPCPTGLLLAARSDFKTLKAIRLRAVVWE